MNLIERAIAALQGRDPRELLEAELSHGDIQRQLHKALKEGKPSGVYCYINDVYDDWFVYTEEGNGSYKAWAQRYSINEGNVAQLVDSPWEVIQRSEWIAASSASTTEAQRNLAPPLPTYTSELEQPVVEAEPAIPEGATQLIESATPLLEKALRKDRTFPVKLISPGWGSSGYYSKAVLEKAAKAGKFPAGLKMFWNHPTQKEADERPERDLRDLAAKTISAGVFKENGPDGPGIYADAQAYSHYAPHIEELAEDIGLSIRGWGSTTTGEAEGQKGALVEDVALVQSADFVTQAGRGGKVLQLMEAARAVASAAVDHPKEDAMGDQLEESAALKEANDKAASERTKRRGREEALALREAGDIVRDALVEQKLHDITKKRLAETLIASAPTVDVDDELKLDTDKFKTQVSEAINAAKAEIAAITGQGEVTTLGESGGEGMPSGDASVEPQEALVEAFRKLGFTEEAAKQAAIGRIQ